MTGSALRRWTLHPEGVGRRILFISLDLGEGSGEGREQKIGRQSKAGGFMDGPFEVLGGALGGFQGSWNGFSSPFGVHFGASYGPHLDQNPSKIEL